MGIFRLIRRLTLPLAVLFIAALLGGIFWLGRWSVYHGHPGLAASDQANAILAQVGKLIQLPAGETPTMATIKNAASAKKQQPFLTKAENGDVLIVYSQAGEALLYRPSTGKLIAVGPVDNASASAAAPVTSGPPSVAATTTATTTSYGTTTKATN